jgi:hypothetical protein
MSSPIAIDAVDISIRSIGKVGRVQLMLAFATSEALLVVSTRFGDLLLSIKNHSMAPWTSIGIAIFTRYGSYVSRVQVGLGLMPKHVRVAQLAVDVAIRPLGAKLVV